MFRLLTVVMLVVLAAVVTSSLAVTDDCCMTQLLNLSAIDVKMQSTTKELFRKNSIDQRVFLTTNYNAISGLLLQIGVAKALDIFHIYATLHQAASADGVCRLGGICILDGDSSFMCKSYEAKPAKKSSDALQPVIDQILKLETELSKVNARNDSVTTAYTRWGRNDCPSSSSLVYQGYAAGAYHGDLGSGADPQCLPKNPIYDRYSDFQWGAIMYPGVFKLQGQSEPWHAEYTDKMANCAVCEARGRSTTIMVPGRNKCPAGWTTEYFGYLMSANFNIDHRSMFLCFDDQIQAGEDISSSYSTHNFYVVGVDCRNGPLCPPYFNARELTCAVCSK